MKTEIISQLEELEKIEQIEEIVSPLRELQNAFKTLKQEIAEQQKKEFLEKPEEEQQQEVFEVVFPEDFQEITDRIEVLRSKVKEWRNQQAEEEKQNALLKENILEKLEALIQGEENIGKAFADFKEIQTQWDAVGKVPGNVHKEVNAKYHRLVEDFYYNMKIYKEIREYDLKKNYDLKAELIERTKKLVDEEIIKNIEPAIKAIQKEWSDIGPVPRDLMDEQKKQFWSTVDIVYDKIKGFYKELKSSLDENLEKKTAFVAQVEEILKDIETYGAKEWQQHTDVLVKLQADWKNIGPAPKKVNDEVWQNFRTACDTFFEKKKNFFEGLRSSYDDAKEKKEKLIAQADALKDSTDWKNTTEKLIQLQKKWKEAGSASQKFEQELWKKFRATCDSFFNRKKDFFSNIDENQKVNLEAKEALITEVEKYELTGDKEQDLATLRTFSTRWTEIDFVPRKDAQRVNNAFSKAMDDKYSALDLNEQELELTRFKHKLEPAIQGNDPYRALEKERRFLRDKIRETEGTILQYKNNLGFISGSKSADSLRRDVEKKISRASKNLEIFVAKLKVLDKMEDKIDEGNN
ncbi:MAG: DUF349 domain-containing protein [Luteibaculaceae bacterium]